MWVKISTAPPDRSGYIRHSADDSYLIHYQVKGAKHGLRRYQNPDGSLTELGRIHYGVGDPRARRQQEREYKRNERETEKSARKERVNLAEQGIKAGKARKKWESMSDEEKMKIYDKNMKISRDERYKKQKEAEAQAKAKENSEKPKNEAPKETQEKAPSKREQRKAAKEEAKREEQIKKDTEKVNEELKKKNQNESPTPPKPEKVATSSADYRSMSKAMKATAENLGLVKGLVDTIEGARQRNAVRNAVGERKLTKPISEMSDQEINTLLNRWVAEDRIANATVGQRSRAADRVGTALDVIGNVTLQTSNAFGIAENIRSIAERR